MEKKKVKVNLFDDYLDDDYKIDEFLEIINEAKENGATDIKIDSDYESSNVGMTMYFEREETDEEFEARQQAADHYKKAQYERERKEFERLKEKFG